MILFSKFSNDRAPEFQIVTEIIEEDGKKSVRKHALNPSAERHILAQKEIFLELEKIFEGTCFQANKVELKDKDAFFEFLEGETLEQHLDSYLPSDVDGLLQELNRFSKEMDLLAKDPFVPSEGFSRIFPDVKDNTGWKASAFSDLDLDARNIILRGDSYYVIDYEWTLPFPVPVDFIKWRLVYDYSKGSSARSALSMETLLKAMGVDPKDSPVFFDMEQSFQNWVRAPFWRNYQTIRKEGIPLVEMTGEGIHALYAAVYFDRGNGFSEKDSVPVPITEDGHLSVDVPVEGVRAVRLDPTEIPSCVMLREVLADGHGIGPAAIDSNGLTYDQCFYVFPAPDPQIRIRLPEGTARLVIEADLDAGYRKVSEGAEAQFPSRQYEKARLKNAEETIDTMTRSLHAVMETRGIRTYRAARARLGKSDPFASIRPEVTNGAGIYLAVDRRKPMPDAIHILGWAADPEYPGERFRVLSSDGGDASVRVTRTERADVTKMLGLSDGRRPGFHIELSYDHLDELPLTIEVETPRGVLHQKIDLIADPVRRREVRAARRKALPPGKTLPAAEYDEWAMDHEKTEGERAAERDANFASEPLISLVVPLYETPEDFLKELVDSVEAQTYANWELVFADGSQSDHLGFLLREMAPGEKRIRYIHLSENRGISENTNAAIREAKGEWIAFADHDDVLDPSAFWEVVNILAQNPKADLVYTDEDKLSVKGHFLFQPFFKPDYDPDYLTGTNYICHFLLIRASLLSGIGLLDPDFDGAQDYDLVLRASERARDVVHVPKVLYHWRSHSGSTAADPGSKRYAFEKGRKAVEAHLRRIGLRGKVEETSEFGHYRTSLAVEGRPLVSVLIPSRDHPELLRRCVRSILAQTDYHNYEILIIENGSHLTETHELYRTLTEVDARVRVIRWSEPDFNYSRINNFAAREAKGDYLLFLNNDTEVLMSGWMEEMLGYCSRTDVGAVGAYLTYPDGRIQHCGVILGICGGVATHMFGGMRMDAFPEGSRARATQDVSAVTAAAMMTKRKLFFDLGGFEESLAVAYNDIDYCLKVRNKGLLVVADAYARLLHDESASRGSDAEEGAKKARLAREAQILLNRWPAVFGSCDPYYNPNLTTERPDFSLLGGTPAD